MQTLFLTGSTGALAGADLVVVSCDYDFGAPAALAAEAAGKVSFFLCAESIKAGIQGVGPHSFSASVLANSIAVSRAILDLSSCHL